MGAAYTTPPMRSRASRAPKALWYFDHFSCSRAELRCYRTGQVAIFTPEFHSEKSVHAAKHETGLQGRAPARFQYFPARAW
jgi:hypothetical protein